MLSLPLVAYLLTCLYLNIFVRFCQELFCFILKPFISCVKI
nr:MAG TPA: hypothetical protein [Caudoviricetes sp.]DAW83898.1 MAG TPA: hypothetical protein [Bacteriophage sp.]